jgi:hypothetical protein
LLQEKGVKLELPPEQSASINIMTGIEAGGSVTNTINGLHIHPISGYSGRLLRARADAAFAALRSFVASGGRFMVILNDMPHQDQTDFWQQVWQGGLALASGADLLLVVHAGPKANQQPHHDCPQPDERMVLPVSVEEDSSRDAHFWDDLVDAFRLSGIEEPYGPASAHLANNRDSILHMNMKLGTAIMNVKKGMARQKQ